MARKPASFLLNRRDWLVGSSALVCVVAAAPATGQSPVRGTLARLKLERYPSNVGVLVVEDRVQSRWRRAERKPDISSKLAFRSADRFTAAGRVDAGDGGWWIIDEPVLRSAHAGAVPGLEVDASQEIQAVLDAAALLGRPADDEGAQYRVDRSVTLPEGVTWQRANLQAGKPGINVVLVSSNSQLLDFDIRGTGAISRRTGGPSQVNERAVYPAQDRLRGAVIEGRITNITVGVHLQPLTEDGEPPAECRIDVKLTDIVGRAGTAEGYGVLLSPAVRCAVRARATGVQRHAVYLSAGASYNTVDAVVTNCMQDAITIYSLASQPPCTGNRLSVDVRGVRVSEGELVGSNSTCFSIYGKANQNVAHVTARARGEANGPAAYAAVLVRGLEGQDGPFPQGNRLTVDASGVFSGPYVVLSSDAIDTVVEGGRIDGRGSAGVIGFTDTRSNRRTFRSGGRVSGVTIDGGDSRVAGIVVATERSPVIVEANVHFTRVLSPMRDVTGKLQRKL
jgi:hypothetical protein